MSDRRSPSPEEVPIKLQGSPDDEALHARSSPVTIWQGAHDNTPDEVNEATGSDQPTTQVSPGIEDTTGCREGLQKQSIQEHSHGVTCVDDKVESPQELQELTTLESTPPNYVISLQETSEEQGFEIHHENDIVPPLGQDIAEQEGGRWNGDNQGSCPWPLESPAEDISYIHPISGSGEVTWSDYDDLIYQPERDRRARTFRDPTIEARAGHGVPLSIEDIDFETLRTSREINKPMREFEQQYAESESTPTALVHQIVNLLKNNEKSHIRSIMDRAMEVTRLDRVVKDNEREICRLQAHNAVLSRENRQVVQRPRTEEDSGKAFDARAQILTGEVFHPMILPGLVSSVPSAGEGSGPEPPTVQELCDSTRRLQFRIREVEVQVRLIRVKKYLSVGEFQAAVQVGKEAEAIVTNELDYGSLLHARTHYWIGRAQCGLENWEEAAASFEMADLAGMGDDAEAWNLNQWRRHAGRNMDEIP